MSIAATNLDFPIICSGLVCMLVATVGARTFTSQSCQHIPPSCNKRSNICFILGSGLPTATLAHACAPCSLDLLKVCQFYPCYYHLTMVVVHTQTCMPCCHLVMPIVPYHRVPCRNCAP